MNEKRKILIVDDDLSVRDTLEMLLASEDYGLYFAENGEQALKKAADLTPDLILLDVMMPGMDGFEVCRRLRSHRLLAEIPIIILTTLDDRESRLEGIKAGADDFISKPFDRHELRLRVQTIIRLDRYRNLLMERKEKEELESRLRQTEKMEVVGGLAAGIAHDFNNILFPILMNTELAMGYLPGESEALGFLKEVVIAVDRAKNLTCQILTFSRQSDHQKIPLKIYFIIKEALKLIESSIPESITFNQFIDKKCGMVMADPTEVHQIVMNLCTNAWHAMKDKGGDLTVTLTTENKNVKLTVSDTGRGIEEEILKKIFDPYFTTKKIGEGTGMGLSVVHGIIKRHKWKISVESTVGKGTVFEILLPVIESKSVMVKTESKETLPRGNERILLVDDDDQILKSMEKIVGNSGYHVTAHKSSLEALHVFASKPHDFDLIITNHSMPYMTGVQLSDKIMEIRNDIPIILCTGFSDLNVQKQAQKTGAKTTLMKPVTNNRMLNTIRSMLDGVIVDNDSH